MQKDVPTYWMCRIRVLKQRFTLCPVHLRPGFLSWPAKGTFGPEMARNAYLPYPCRVLIVLNTILI